MKKARNPVPISMNLSVGERVILLNVLPQQGDIITLRIVRDLQSALSFSEREHKKLKFNQEGQRVNWTGELSKTVPIGPKAHVVIQTELEKQSREGTLPMQAVTLYERFCGEVAEEAVSEG